MREPAQSRRFGCLTMAMNHAVNGADVAPSDLQPIEQWWLAFWVMLASMVATVDKHILALLVSPIKADLELSDTQISLLLSAAFAVVYTIAVLVAGPAADRFKRKTIIAGGIILWSVMALACGMAANSFAFFLARLGVGAGEGAVQPSLYSVLRSGMHASRRGRAFSMLALAPMWGAGLAVLIGGATFEMFTRIGPLHLHLLGAIRPWQMTIICIALIGIPVACLALTVREPPRPALTSEVNPLRYAEAFSFLGQHRLLFICLLGYATMNAGLAATYASWIPSILIRQWGLSPIQIGTQFGLLMLIVAPIGLAVSGPLMDFAAKAGKASGPLWAGLISTGVIGLTATLVPLTESIFLFWALFGIQVLLGGVPAAALGTLLSSVTPDRLMGKVSAISLVAMGVFGAALSPTMAALIGDNMFAHLGARSIGRGVSLLSFIVSTVGVLLLLVGWRRLTRFRPIHAHDAGTAL